MEKTLATTTRLPESTPSTSLSQRLGWGFLGGLAGTLVMDLLLMGALLAIKQPALSCFSIVGDTVARFAAMFEAHFTGGVPTGVVTHYVVGPLFGMVFGGVLMRLQALRRGSLKKTTLAAFLYVEILSLPILATTPLLLKMDAPATLKWFIGAFFMHLILSIVLGLIVGLGLRLAPLASQN